MPHGVEEFIEHVPAVVVGDRAICNDEFSKPAFARRHHSKLYSGAATMGSGDDCRVKIQWVGYAKYCTVVVGDDPRKVDREWHVVVVCAFNIKYGLAELPMLRESDAV